MVRGLQQFSAWFEKYTDQYVLIGGTAASLAMNAAGVEFRQTKDLDIVKRGRPAGSGNKISTTVRFDSDVIDAFRAGGPGWQTRMNDVLRDWLIKHPVDKENF